MHFNWEHEKIDIAKNDSILTNEQWSELSAAVNIMDRNGDRTMLNTVLISIMKNVVDYLDDDDDGTATCKDNDQETQQVITSIESELAEILTVNVFPSWCCRRQRIQPFIENTHPFSDYLINLTRAKASDQDNSGFISKENIQRCFGAQLTERRMAELLQFVDINNDGNVNYREFATLMLITPMKTLF